MEGGLLWEWRRPAWGWNWQSPQIWSEIGGMQEPNSEIGYFDPLEAASVLAGNLPHWRQEGVTYFVTFRLADSIPREAVQLWRRQQTEWLDRHLLPFSNEEKREYFELFVRCFHRWLDKATGVCLLRKSVHRDIVSNAMGHFDGTRYHLGHWVIMPNHVHAIITPIGDNSLSEILHSWKSFTSKKINAARGEVGTVWQKESFDHIVRSPETLERIEGYILENPKGLSPSDYSIGGG